METARIPPAGYWKGSDGERLLQFKHNVEAVMAEFPQLSATSWYRDPAYNASVGGDMFSQHLIGLAVDLDWMGATLADYRLVAHRALGRGLSSVIYFTPKKSYIHIQCLADPLDPNPALPLLPESGTIDLVALVRYIIDRNRSEPFIREVLD